jgi:hypothetical protein
LKFQVDIKYCTLYQLEIQLQRKIYQQNQHFTLIPMMYDSLIMDNPIESWSMIYDILTFDQQTDTFKLKVDTLYLKYTRVALLTLQNSSNLKQAILSSTTLYHPLNYIEFQVEFQVESGSATNLIQLEIQLMLLNKMESPSSDSSF